MNDELRELRQRVSAFEFDDPMAESTFSARVARENRWTRKYARRVIEEYRRFAFLSVAAGHPVSPSESVDQVWHLHLIYTHSYWDEFCGKVLRRPLHHLPSKGGESEQTKLADWYERTLASYERLFGELPPLDIWPSSAQRQQQQVRMVQVDAERFWILRKWSWSQSGLVSLAALFGVLLIVGCVPNVNVPAIGPLDWNGPAFLKLFIPLQIVAVILGVAWRYWLRSSTEPLDDVPELSPYEVAYLAGAETRTINAVLVRLLSRGHLRVTDGQKELRVAEPLSEDTLPIERAVWQGVESEGRLSKLHRHLANEAELIAERLKRLGLVLHSSDEWKARLLPAGVQLLVLIFGIAKIAIGLNRNRPVEILVVSCLFTLVVMILFVALRPIRTRNGDSWLNKLEHDHAALKDPMKARLAVSLPLALALFGPAVLADGPLDDLRKLLRPSNSSGCSSGCGGSGCGGGGGGCGGCGGGGD